MKCWRIRIDQDIHSNIPLSPLNEEVAEGRDDVYNTFLVERVSFSFDLDV